MLGPGGARAGFSFSTNDAPFGTPLGGRSHFGLDGSKRQKAGIFVVPLPKRIGAVMADNPDMRPRKGL
jgi:hypothetical protein